MVDGDCRQWLVKQVRGTQPVDQLGNATLVDVGANVGIDEVRGRIGGEGNKLSRCSCRQRMNVEQLRNE